MRVCVSLFYAIRYVAVLTFWSALARTAPRPGLSPVNPGQAQLYVDVQSVIDWPTTELVKKIPELKGFEPASSQDPLPTILHHLGANVAAFFRDFQNTDSTERILAVAYKPGGVGVMRWDFEYNYVALVAPGKGGFQEYRTDSKGNRVEPGGLVVTKGFIFSSRYFHSEYQSDSVFRYLGCQVVRGRDTQVIAFAQVPGKARLTERVAVGGRTTGILIQGVAWIDPATYQLLRMRTDLLVRREDIGLDKQTTVIQYERVRFERDGLVLWLPCQVSVAAIAQGYSLSTQHRYSDFRLFTVQTQEKSQR